MPFARKTRHDPSVRTARPAAVLATAVLAASAWAQGSATAPSGPVRALGPLSPSTWLRADAGVERGISSLVAAWRDAGPARVELAQALGKSRPYWDRFALGGEPALSFDGNDFLEAPDAMPLGSSTVVALVVPEAFAGANEVWAGAQEGATHAFGFDAEGRLRAVRAGVELVSGAAAMAGAPVLVACVHDSATGGTELRLDGTVAASGTLPAIGDASAQVGAHRAKGHFEGLVAEVLVYDRALDPLEIALVEALVAARHLAAPPFPEVSFTSLPRDAQILPRDAQGGADVEVAGAVEDPGWSSIAVHVTRAGAPWSTLVQPLVYAGGEAPFQLAPRIDAGLFQHEVSIRLEGPAGEVEVARVENVASGDLFLVMGQSNAVAWDWHGEGLANQSQSEWIRSYGTPRWIEAWAQGPVVAKVPHLDRHWGMADGETTHEFAAIGGWALRMGEVLVEETGVPVGFLNGAMEGTSVLVHQRADWKPDASWTLYGRLLQRANEAGFADSARALFWYQGDSDGEMAHVWTSGFEALLEDWPKDYPALERVFLFQIREGCGLSNTKVREAQRNLPKVHPQVYTMSTTGAPGHDGCHFHYAGYRELGDRMARVALRDLYGAAVGTNVDPPDVAAVTWTNAARTKLLVETSDPSQILVVQPGAEEDFELEDGVPVVSVEAVGSALRLELAAPSSAKWISYTGHAFDGPWILNARGVGAFTFFEVPIGP